MNKIQLKDKLVDLVFDKYCRLEEVAYQEDKLVCKDLEEMKRELKETLNLLFDQPSYITTTYPISGSVTADLTNNNPNATKHMYISEPCTSLNCSTCILKNFCIQKDKVEVNKNEFK